MGNWIDIGHVSGVTILLVFKTVPQEIAQLSCFETMGGREIKYTAQEWAVSWLNEKISVALDKNWMDLSNLQGKLQKHQTFEAEIMANQNRIRSIDAEGEQLINEGHYAVNEIEPRIKQIQDLWKELLQNCSQKKSQLLDAHKALNLQRSIEDMEKWLGEVEKQLNHPAIGVDLVSVRNLLNKHQDLEEDISSYVERMQGLLDQSEEFIYKKHFLSEEIRDRVDVVLHRYRALGDPIKERRRSLEASVLLYQFFRNLDAELAWVQEKLQLASAKDTGQSLNTVQSLQKKHQALQNEISCHDSLINDVLEMGKNLAKSGHFGSREISKRLWELKDAVETLKEEAEKRSKLLREVHAAQLFFSELMEAELWLEERKPLLESTDYGKDEDTTQALLRQLENIDLDLASYKSRMFKLRESGNNLSSMNHPERHTIMKRLQDVESEYETLLLLTETLRKTLLDRYKLYHFEQEVQEIATWLSSKQRLADSQEYGQDLEDVELLQKTFEHLEQELSGLGHNKMAAFHELVTSLKRQCHSFTEEITAQANQVNQQWNTLQQAARNRAQNLEAALQVHRFDYDVSDLKAWIQEKGSMLGTDDLGHDLNYVQTLLRQHEGVERELGAISSEVERIGEEARRLGQMYPHIKENLQERLKEVVMSWDSLHQKAREWKEKLTEAEQIQAYVSECRVFMSWVNEMDTLLDTEEQARGSMGAEQLCKRHKEYKREIDKQRSKYEELQAIGTELRENRHILSREVDEKLNEMSEQMDQVLKKWEKQEALYEEELWRQAQLREIELMAAWLGSKEGLITTNNYGDSVNEVEDLIKKHEDFEKMLAVQDEKFSQLENLNKGEGFQRGEGIKEKERKVSRVPSLKRKGSDKKTSPLRIFGRTNSDTERVPKSWSKEIVVSPAPRSPSTSELFLSPGIRTVGSLRNPDATSDQRQTIIQSPLSPRSFTFGSSEIDSPTKRFSNPNRPGIISKPLSRIPSCTSMEQSAQDLTALARDGIRAESPTKFQSPLSNSPSSSSPTSRHSSRTSLSGVQPGESGSTKRCLVDPVPSSKECRQMDTPAITESASLSTVPQQPSTTGTQNNKTRATSDAGGFQSMEGTLCRKQILQSDGTKTDSETWDTHFVILASQTLSFYESKTTSLKDSPCSPSLSITEATCEEVVDSTFHLRLSDGAEYLFSDPSGSLMDEWIQKIRNNLGCSMNASSGNATSPTQSPQQPWQQQEWAE
ncbi:spectrin beta chain, non-erythrocytic 5-like [Narcine bancroftii]|uniref:spectrin beta chain, non-erythrocytic 5-like n=1 Tax=Narcine bancroftii TaxID=1343680 RepID=UPI00383192D8